MSSSSSSKKRKNDEHNSKKSRRRIDDSMDEEDFVVPPKKKQKPDGEQQLKKKKNVTFDFNKTTSITIERDPLKSKSQDYLYAKTLPNCNYKDISFPCKISKSYFTSNDDYQEFLSLKKSKKGKKGKRKHYKTIQKTLNITLKKNQKNLKKNKVVV